MEFKVKDRVLRPLNVSLAPGQLVHEERVFKTPEGPVTTHHALCKFRGVEFHAPANTTVFQRAVITRGGEKQREREYVVLWYISGERVDVFINRVNPYFMPGDSADKLFGKIKDDREFAEISQLITEHHLERIAVGDEVPYVIEEDPLGFNRGKT